MTTSINERTHFFIKIYLSHFILERVAKGLKLVMCERWVGDRRQTATYWPKVLLATIAVLLPHSAGLLNRGPEGLSPLSGAGSHSGILPPTRLELTASNSNSNWTNSPSNSNCNCNSNWTRTDSRLELTQAVCGTWLYNCLTSTYFLWAYASAPNSTTSTGQGDIPISSTGCTCFLFDSSVEGQYVTPLLSFSIDFFVLCQGLIICLFTFSLWSPPGR